MRTASILGSFCDHYVFAMLSIMQSLCIHYDLCPVSLLCAHYVSIICPLYVYYVSIVCSMCPFYVQVIERHISQELPFMASENIIMEMVKFGADRQVKFRLQL